MSELKEKVRSLPPKPGVYIMRDRLGKVIYVGKAKNLKARVSSYFQASKRHFLDRPKLKSLVSLIWSIDHIVVKSDKESLILENKLIKEWKPKFNKDLTDDKGSLWIKVDLYHIFPSFRIEYYRQKDPKGRYFGPFIHSQAVRLMLKEMRIQYGVLLGDTTPEKIDDNYYSLYSDARAEIYTHPNKVTIKDYQKRVEAACLFLEGKAKSWQEEIKQLMETAAAKNDFESAAKWRDLYLALEKNLSPTRKFIHTPSVHTAPVLKNALFSLQKELGLSILPNHIECFDISHISGTFVVASMICFKEGKPCKKEYRRFKIKNDPGNNDVKSISEVVSRRYQKLVINKGKLPDLIVIDGGLSQLNSALNAFKALHIPPPLIIGLAKKQETIILPHPPHSINLSLNHTALQLLQRMRDEAHRFANTFNADLRRKAIQASILDHCPLLGPAKKAILLNHFKTIQALKKATLEEIAQIKGIGPKLAQNIADLIAQ